MTKSDILTSLIDYYCEGNKTKFANMIGITPQTLSNWILRNTIDYDIVYNGCKNLSGDFLLSGEGAVERQFYSGTSQIDNEVAKLCKLLIDNYSQRDEAIKKLLTILK